MLKTGDVLQHTPPPDKPPPLTDFIRAAVVGDTVAVTSRGVYDRRYTYAGIDFYDFAGNRQEGQNVFFGLNLKDNCLVGAEDRGLFLGTDVALFGRLGDGEERWEVRDGNL